MGKRAKRSPKTRNRPVIETLEPRILLSADLPGIDAILSPHDPDDIVDTDAVLERAEAAFALLADQVTEHQAGAETGTGDATASPTELIIVDGGIEDPAALIEDLLASADDDRRFDVVILDPQRDGIDQIADVLSDRNELAAVHLLSHGADGEFRVGDVTVDQAILDSRASDIAAWGQGLATDGDLLIYGCNLAASADGVALADTLAAITGADVAASDDRTGGTVQGGDWDLEYRAGDIGTGVPFVPPAFAQWQGTLDITTGLILHNTFDTDASDSSGNNYDGTLTNGALIDTLIATNQIGDGKVNLDGFNDFVDFSSHAANFDNLTEGTIATWVYAEDTTYHVIWQAGDADDGDSRVALIYDGARESVNFYVNNDSTVLLHALGPHNAVPQNTWVHVAFTVSASGNKLYVNGVEQALTYTDGNASTNSFLDDVSDIDFVSWGVDKFGGGSFGGHFDGFIDDGRVYSRALSASDVAELYNHTGASPQTFTVTNTNDSGAGSLRQAILDANANAGTHDTIDFAIGGAGVQTITLASPLPDITDPVNLDATTQGAYVGTPLIEIDASGAAGATAILNLRTDDSTIKGFSLYGSVDEGIEIDGSTGFGDNNTVQGNWVGIKADDTVVGNAGDGILLSVDAVDNQVGGTGANEGNVVTGSGESGIEVRLGASTGNTIRGNSVYGNDGLGIDLGDDGRTLNDAGDSDSGANNLQNWPLLTAVSIADDGTLSYTVDTSSFASGSYQIDFYASSDRDGGAVEGERYLGSGGFVPWGNAAFAGMMTGVTLAPGEYVTATVTDANGNTSEFSNYAVATDSDSGGATPGDLVATTTSEGGLSLNSTGGNDAYLVADQSPFSGQTETTIEVQFATNTPAAGITTLFSYADATNQDELFFGVDASGQLFLRTSSDGSTGYGSIATAPQLFDGERHSVAVTWENATGVLKFYVDGEELGAGRNDFQKTTTIDAGGTVVIGQHQGDPGSAFITNDTFAGTLYNVRVFDHVRTAGEIAASYVSDLPYDEAGMLAQWSFDQLSSDGTVVESASGNNLTVAHVAQTGFTPSAAGLTFTVDENALDGTVIGTVVGTDAERDALVASLLAGDPELHYNAETGKFYKGVSTTGLWGDARTAAEATTLNGVSGQLVTIRSAAENQFVRQIAANDVGFDVWIGATDSTVEGEWRWVDGGSEADRFWQGNETGYNPSGAYHNFQAGQPNDAGGNEDVVRLEDVTGEWLDADHDNHNFYGYIVEWDADAVLDATQKLTYTIQSQSVAGAFAIASDTGVITVADGTLLDYETNASHGITVRITDVDGNTYDELFTVALKNLTEANNAPTDLSSGIELNTDGGNDAYLVAGDGGSLLFNRTALTVEIAFESTRTDTSTLLTYATGTTDKELSILVHSSNELRVWVAEGQFVSTAIDYLALNDGSLHSLGLSWENTNGDWAVYVDGELVDRGTGISVGQTIDGGGELVFGQDQDTLLSGFSETQIFEGTLHDIRLWGGVRGAEEIALNYQYKFDTGSLPSGLIANWQMDGFNGSNEVVDVVSGNNLSVGHAAGAGFTASDPVEDLHVSENAANGTSVGYGVPSDPDVGNDIVSDGLFLEAQTGSDQFGLTGAVGDWTVTSGSIDLFATASWTSPLGGSVINLDGGSPATIGQALTTTVGQQYQVVFALSGDFSGGEAVKDLRVSASGQSHDFTITQAANWAWGETTSFEHRSFTFTADSAGTVLSFASLETVTSQHGPYVADIRVVEIPAAKTAILNNDPSLSYDAATGKFYRVVTSPEQFSNAIASATSESLNGVSGQLVTIASAYENDLVRHLAGGNDVWMGATDATTEGAWRWLSGATDGDQFWSGGTGGAAMSGYYANWTAGLEPNNWTGVSAAGEDAAVLDSDGTWFDLTDDPSQTIGYVIEWDANAVLSNFTFALTDDANGRFAIDSSTGEITVADGTQLDYEANTSHGITVEVTDAAGNSYSEALTIAVDNGYDIAQTVPAAQATDPDTALVFSTANGNAITVSDTVAADDTRLQVYISTNFNGTLTLSQTTGLSILGGTNGGTFMTLQGTESAINAAFEGMTFMPASGYSGPVTIDMTTSLGADLEGHYAFEGNADDTSVGIVQHGSLVGDASITVDGTRGQVLSLDGVGDAVQINSVFGNPAALTIGGWVNFSSTGRQEFISLHDRVHIALDDGGFGVKGSIQTGAAAWNDLASGVSLSGTGWHHVIYSFDDAADEHRLYIDGELVAREETTDSIYWTGATTTYIGQHPSNTAWSLNGLIDDARIYDRALSAGEVAALARGLTSVSDAIAVTVNTPNQAPYFTSRPSAAAETIASLVGASSVTSGDLDNDGDIDLVTTTSAGELRWHANDGSGSFSAGVVIASAQDFTAVATQDLDGDGDIDIVAMNDDPTDAGDSVYVLTNNFIGSGVVTFDTTRFEGPGVGDSDGGQDLALGDIDGDGRIDIAGLFYRNIGDSQLVVFEQNTLGGWTKTYTDAISNGHGIELVDLDGDTRLDVVIGDYQWRETHWYENDGNATAGFTRQMIHDEVTSQIFDMTVGDFDADGDTDIAFVTWGSPDRVVLLRSDGAADPAFTREEIATLPGLPYHIEAADTNGDGTLDLIVTDEAQDSIHVYENDGTASFTLNTIDTESRGPVWAEAADVDGDGHNDLVFAARDANFVGLHTNQGDGSYIRGSVNEDVPLGTLGVQIADDDAGAAPLEVTIVVTNGDIVLNTASVTVLSGASSSPTITFEGTVADLNTALANLTYSPTADFNGLGEVRITVDDRGNTGVGGALTATETLFVEVVPQPDAPTDAHYTTWIGGSEFVVNTETTNAQGGPAITALVGGGFVVSWESMAQDGDGSGIYIQRYDAAGNPVGLETRVNTTTAEAQSYPEITALANGGFVVVWQSNAQDGDGDGVYARVFDANGTATTGEIHVSSAYTTGDQDTASVVGLDGGGFAVAWESNGQDGDSNGVYFQRYDDTGVPQGGVTQVDATTAGDQGNPRMTATDDGGFVVVWHDYSTGDGEVKAQRYDALGTPVGGEIPVNTVAADSQNDPDVVALTGGGFVVVWESVGQDGDGNGLYAQRFDATGNPQGGELAVNSTSAAAQQDHRVEALGDGGFLVVWESAGGQDGDNAGIFAQQFDAAGDKVNGEFLVNTTTVANQANPHLAALDDGRLVAVWDDDTLDGDGDAVVGRIFVPALDENSPVGTVAAVASQVVDPDSGDSYGYALIDSAGGAFDINPSTGTITVLDPGLIDFEATPSLDMTVRITDPVSGTHDEVVTIHLNNLAEANTAGLSQDYLAELDGHAPLIHLRLGESSGTTAVDAAGGHDGTYTGSVVLGASGAIDGDADTAVTFSNNEYVQVAHAADLLVDEGTFQLWFKTSDITQEGTLFSKDAMTYGDGGHITAELFPNGEIQVRLQSNGAQYFVRTDNATQAITENEWHHFAFSFGAGGMKLYIDGQLMDSDAYAGGLGTSSGGSGNAETLLIGAANDYSSPGTTDDVVRYYEGQIDEFALLGTQLTDNAVLSLYQSSAPAITIDEDTSQIFSSANGNAITVSDTLSGTDAPMRVTLAVNDGVLTLAQTTGLTFVDGADGSASLVIDGSESDLNAALDGMTFTPDADFNGSVTLHMTTALASGLDGHYTFDGGDANDQSAGAGHDGVMVGGIGTTTHPERGQVLNLDNAGEYVRIDSLYDQPSDVTLAAWVNFNNLTANGGEVISLGNDIALRLNDAAQGVTGFFWDGSTHQYIGSGTDLAAGDWHHVAFSFDDGNDTQRLYIDGQLVGSASHTASITWTGLFPQTTIGTHADLTNTDFDFRGMIDDALIYTRAASSEEIAALATDRATATDNVTITVSPVNDAPVVSSSTGTYPYTEGAGAVVLGGSATVTDVDSADFDGGQLVYRITNNGLAEDRLDIRNQGTGAGQVGISGMDVTYNYDDGNGAIVIGTYTGPTTADTALVVTFNTSATVEAVQATLKNVTYENTSQASSDSTRTLQVYVTDGDGGTSNTVTGSVAVTAVNDAPVVDHGGPYAIAEGEALGLDASGTSDVDSATLTYRWDLNNDTIYDIATTSATTTPLWSAMTSYGIDDDGVYTIGLQVDDGSGGVVTTSTTVTVANVAPTLTATGAPEIDGGLTYTLNLADSDPGDDTITGWTINWGDGTIETLVGDPDSATHTYATDLVGLTLDITVSATDEDGTHFGADMLVPAYIGDLVYRLGGSDGTAAGTFAPGTDGINGHANIAVMPSGNYLVSGVDSGNIVEYQHDGTLVGDFIAAGVGGAGALDNPGGIAYGPDGNLYVADHGDGEILRYDGTDGSFIDTFVASGTIGLSNPLGLVFGPDGDLYVASRGSEGVLRFDGTTGAKDTGFSAPAINMAEDLTFGPDGQIYVASFTDGVYKLDSTSGASLGLFVSLGAGGLASAAGVDFGPDGRLYVADQDADAIRRYDGATGAYIDDHATGVDGPAYMDFTADHRVTIDANDAPTITSAVGGGTRYESDVAATYFHNTLTITDPDSLDFHGGQMTVTITANGEAGDRLLVVDGQDVSVSGSDIAYDSGGGAVVIATFTGGDGTNPLVITFNASADLAGVEAVGQQVAYRTEIDDPSDQTRTLEMVVTDGDGGTSNTVTRSMAVVPVNDAPVNTLPASIDVTEDLASPLTGISISDVDVGGGSLLVTLSVPTGTLAAASGGGVAVGGSATALTLAGTLADINTFLAGSNVTYTTAADANGTVTLTVDTSDEQSSAYNGAQSDSDTATLNIVALNDAPVLDDTGSPTLPGITEDDTDNAGMTVADLLATGAGGDPITDVDGDPDGIAITTRNNGNGIWQYSIDAGVNWSNVGTVAEDSALLLRATDLVRFAPDGENGIAQTFAFRAWDQTAGTAGDKADTTVNGGATAFSTTIETASITVSDVNDAPVLDNSGTITLTAQSEDSGPPVGAVGTVVQDIVSLGSNVSDVDNGTQVGIAITAADTAHGSWWYSLDSGNNWSALGSVSDASARVLNANSNTRLYFEPDSDFHGTISDAITFRAWDRDIGPSGSLHDTTTHGGTSAFSSATETADLEITPINDAPVAASIEPGALAYAENDGPVAVTTALTLGDVDDADLASAVVRITGNYVVGEDLLRFSDQNGISGTWDAANGTLNLSGSATVAQYQAALRSITYSNGNDAPSDLVRTVSFTVNDGDTDSNTLTRDIAVSPANDAPHLLGTSIVSNGDFSGGLTDWVATGNVDADNPIIRFGQVGGANGQISQTLSTSIGETYALTFRYGDYSATASQSLRVEIDGASPLSHVGITTGAADNSLQPYTVQFTADATTTTLTFTDTSTSHSGVRGYLDDVAVRTDAVPNPAIVFTENDPAMVIDDTLWLADVDDGDLESAQVWISANFAAAEDSLSFSDQNGITGSYDPITGVLDLSGTASVAEYQAALRSVAYANSSEDPSTAQRTVSFQVNDGDTDSNVQTRQIDIISVNDAPVITGDSTGSVTEDVDGDADGLLETAGALNVSDPDVGESVFQAETLTGTYGSLSIDAAGNWTYAADNSQAAIQALAVTETLTDTLTVRTADGTNQDITITIHGSNDAPVLTADTTGGVTEDSASPNLTDTGSLSFTDVDTTDAPTIGVSYNSDAVWTGGALSGGQITALTSGFTADADSWDYTVPNADVQFLGAGETVTFSYDVTVDDGNSGTDTQTVTLILTGADDGPIVGGPNTGSVTEDGTQTASATLTITDADSSDNPIQFANVTPAAGTGGYGLFEITNNVWTYTLNNSHAAVQALDATESLTDSYTFSGPDGANRIVTVTVHGAEDAPTVDTPLPDQAATEDSPFSYTFAANSFGDLDTSDTLTYTATLADDSALPSWLGFDAGTRTFSGTPLNADVGTLSVKVTADDGTSTVSDTFDLVVANTNDAPVITGDSTGSVTEDVDGDGDGDLETTGILTVSDPDVGESVFQAETLTGTYGNLTIDAAGNWGYAADNSQAAIQALAVTEALTDTLTVRTADGTNQDIIITINGANDTPVLTVDITGGVTEDAASPNLTDSGALSFTDVDTTDTPTVGVNYNSDAVWTGGVLSSAQITALTFGFSADSDSWDYTVPNADVQFLAASETVTFSYDVTVDDGNGGTDTQTVTLTITGTNDGPIVGGPNTGSVTEDGIQTTGGTLTITDADASDNPIQFADETPTAGDNGYGSFTITNNAWTYTLDNSHPDVQALDTGEQLTDSYTFSGPDGASRTVTITINGAEDAPTVDTPLPNQAATEDSPFSYTFAANSFGDLDTSDTLTYTATLADDSALPSWLGFDAGTGTFSGTPANADVGTISIKVTANDGTSTVTDTFDLVVANTNDAPTITGDSTGSVTEDVDGDGDGDLETTGVLTVSDPDAGESVFQAETVTGTYGDLTIDAAGNWAYSADNSQAAIQALAVTETLTDTLTVRTADGTTHDVTLTIHGANDTPVLTVDTTGGVTEDSASPNLTDNGALSFTDVDTTDAPTVGVSYNSDAVWSGGTLSPAQITALTSGFTADADSWDYTVANADVQFLAAGETVTFSYDVTVDDGNGGTDTQTVTLTVTGTDDGPIVGGPNTGDVTEDGTQTAGGTLTISDADASDNPIQFADEAPAAGDNGYGTFETSNNVWTYSLNNGHADVQALDTGEQLTDSHTFTGPDGASRTVTVTIHGAEDAPTLDNALIDQNATEDNPFSYTIAANSFGDLDASDTLTYTATLADDSPLPTWLGFDAGTLTFSGTPGNTDVGTLSVKVTADDGTSNVSDTFDLVVGNVNDLPTGIVSIDNATPDQGDTLTASNTLVDADGLSGPIGFQWQRDGSDIVGATGSTYTTTQADVGAVIRVVASYTDDLGTDESVTSAATAAVTNVNDPALITGELFGTVTEDVSPDSTGHLVASGLAVVADPDHGESSFVAGTSLGVHGAFAIDSSGNWTYRTDNGLPEIQQLGQGESLVDSAVITSADGTTESIFIQINGSEDLPIVSGDTSRITTVSVPSVTGSLAIADVDSSDADVTFEDLTAVAGDHGYGEFSLSSGFWSFVVDQANPVVSGLDAGEYVTDTFTFFASDGTAQVVSVRIDGEATATPVTPTDSGDTSTVDERVESDPLNPKATPPPSSAETPPARDPDVMVTGEPDTQATGDATDPVESIAGPLRELPVEAFQSIDPDALAANLAEPPDRDDGPAVQAKTQSAHEALTFLQELRANWSATIEVETGADTDRDRADFWEEVDEMLRQFEQDAELQQQNQRLTAEVMAGFGLSLTAGFVSWALRAGSMAASLLASMPAWRHFDPLPILGDREDTDEAAVADGDRKPPSAADQNERKAEEMFDR